MDRDREKVLRSFRSCEPSHGRGLYRSPRHTDLTKAELMEPRTKLMDKRTLSSKNWESVYFSPSCHFSPDQQDKEGESEASLSPAVQTPMPSASPSGDGYLDEATGYSGDDELEGVEGLKQKERTEAKLEKKKKTTRDEKNKNEFFTGQGDRERYIQWLRDSERRYNAKILQEEMKMARNRKGHDGFHPVPDSRGSYYYWLKDTAQQYKTKATIEEKKLARQRKASDELLRDSDSSEQDGQGSYSPMLKDYKKEYNMRETNKMIRAFAATSFAIGASAIDRSTEAEIKQSPKRNSPEPHNQPSVSGNDSRSYLTHPKITGYITRMGMNPSEVGVTPCPQGHPWYFRFMQLASDSSQNLSQPDANNHEPEPVLSNLHEYEVSRETSEIISTEHALYGSQQPSIGVSPLSSDCQTARVYDPLAMIHASEYQFMPAATTCHQLGPAVPCNIPSQRNLSSAEHFRFSTLDEDDHASVEVGQEVGTTRKPDSSQVKCDMSIDFSQSWCSFLNQAPAEVLGLSDQEFEAKALIDVLAKSHKEFLDFLSKPVTKDSSDTSCEEPAVFPKDNKPSISDESS